MNKDKIFEILNDWNYWDKEIANFYTREFYENLLRKYDLTDEITVLKGIRRAGKSTLLINHIKNLIKSGVKEEEILFINFEDPRFTDELTPLLLDEIVEVYKEYVNNKSLPYIFLDEIQNVKSWEKWVRTYYELKKAKKIYITGSSSKLLSKEFGTALSGRFLGIDVYPLSFNEFLVFNNIRKPTKKDMIKDKIKYKQLFNDYMKIGGFPKVILSEDFLRKKEILTYYETIILKDIVARYNLKSYDNVKKIANFLISNIGKLINLNKVRLSLNISYELVEKYFEYLKDTFLIYELSKYDYSLKKQYFSYKKIYVSDVSFVNHISFKFSENYGRLLENLVFMELKRREKEIYYHKNKKECDFVIKEHNNIVGAIQVTKSLEDLETKKREYDGLIDAMRTYNLKEGLILTEDEEFEEVINDKKSGKEFKVKVMPIWKWLLF